MIPYTTNLKLNVGAIYKYRIFSDNPYSPGNIYPCDCNPIMLFDKISSIFGNQNMLSD